ncbi:adenylyltransferase/sulfurtransferase [Kineosphaera limosa]|uniref:Molybdopterin synthase sulfurylase MoeB n=1 Tax=Kineosphaera limosa NBRC 100340 TaxID=1184609 RepID=K6WCW7_9MICO|nr:molybdopterin-synthase adenylyltransferase MoeB [Kineosphaera limosa]NYE00327.1 adenylyltransferase/sulfurtransferase [Kineosphaera limosa]GAB97125.1 molybdopterin synthase sulfurylase MoeB [Kineosphaera limosa NBRC 100340]
MSTPLPPLVEPGPPLTPTQSRRYARHAILPSIGIEGQRRLLAAKVLVIGAGGLGSPALLYLAAAGVGTIGVIDDDVVDESNLHRQVVHGVADVGRLKVESARDAIARIDPAITVIPHAQRLTVENALEIIGGYDLVLDGADNFATRYLVADACEISGTPCVWGSILRFDGQVSVFWPGRGAVYRDLFPDPPDPALVPSCAEAGVFGVLCAAIGAAMGTEAVKLITGVGRTLVGRLLIYDALEATWRELAIRPDPSRTPMTALEAVGAYCAAPAAQPAEASGRPAGSEIDVETFDALLAARSRGETDFDLVDVREQVEWDLGHIDGARLIPKDQILSGAVKLPTDRPLLLHCAAGGRSGQVLDHLVAQGHADVRHLLGGYTAWERAHRDE